MGDYKIVGYKGYRDLVEKVGQSSDDDRILFKIGELNKNKADLSDAELKQADAQKLLPSFVSPEKLLLDQKSEIQEFIWEQSDVYLKYNFITSVQGLWANNTMFEQMSTRVKDNILPNLKWNNDNSLRNGWSSGFFWSRANPPYNAFPFDSVGIKALYLPAVDAAAFLLRSHSPLAQSITTVYQYPFPGTATMQESVSSDGSRLAVTSPYGEVFVEDFDKKSGSKQFLVYIDLLAKFTASAGAISDMFHLLGLDDKQAYSLAYSYFSQVSCEDQDVGCISNMDIHGADLLYMSLLLGKGLVDAIELFDSVRPVSVWDMFEGYKYAVQMPDPSVKGGLPTIGYVDRQLLYMTNDGKVVVKDGLTAYRFILSAMQLIDAKEWETPWYTRQGVTSLNAMLERIDEVYLNEWDRGPKDIDHTLLHPELIIKYREKNHMSLEPIKEAFLNGELSKDPKRTTYNRMCHYVETLGLLLERDELQWTPKEGKKIRGWIREVMKTPLTGHGYDMAEVSHLYKGAKFIAKHGHKIGF